MADLSPSTRSVTLQMKAGVDRSMQFLDIKVLRIESRCQFHCNIVLLRREGDTCLGM